MKLFIFIFACTFTALTLPMNSFRSLARLTSRAMHVPVNRRIFSTNHISPNPDAVRHKEKMLYLQSIECAACLSDLELQYNRVQNMTIFWGGMAAYFSNLTMSDPRALYMLTLAASSALCGSGLYDIHTLSGHLKSLKSEHAVIFQKIKELHVEQTKYDSSNENANNHK